MEIKLLIEGGKLKKCKESDTMQENWMGRRKPDGTQMD